MALPSIMVGPAAFGGKPDTPSDEDWVYTPANARREPRTDLRGQLDPPWHQGRLLSCSAHAAAAALQHARRRAGHDGTIPSRLFLYYTGVQKAGGPGAVGAFPVGLRDTLRAINEWGAPPEPEWPYPRWRWRRGIESPPRDAYEAGEPVAGTVRYERIPANDLDLVRASLSEGVPVACSIAVHRGFKTLRGSGATMRVPKPGEEPIDRHSVLAVGHDDAEQALILRNSWGVRWGDRGHCRMPYAFAEQLRWANDFWRVASAPS
jgi:C1A family cysteine protease